MAAKIEKPEDIVQLCFVLVDVSGSMEDPFGVKGEAFDRSALTRIAAVRNFLTKWTKIGDDFQSHCLYGLISFDRRVRVLTELTPDISVFHERLEKLEPNGPTRCFDAMKTGADRLIEAGRIYNNAVKRLIVISDGLDNRTKKADIANLPNHLVSNKIRVDVVIMTVDQTEIDRRLVAMAKWTGGAAFCPHTLEDGYRVFENEAFFDINVRHFDEFQKLPITEEMLESYPEIQFTDLDHVVPLEMSQFQESERDPLVSVATFGKMSVSGDGKTILDRKRRLMWELKNLADNEDPAVRVFSYRERIDVWRVLLKGPQGSPYDKGWWGLSVDFPKDYPRVQPLVRFLGSPPFHPNISNEGRICIDTLGRAYKDHLTMMFIFKSIIDLLLHPNYDEPIDAFHGDLLKLDRKAFDAKVWESAANNSRPNVEAWTAEWKLSSGGSALSSSTQQEEAKKVVDFVPTMFMCPLTKRLLVDPVRASSGTYFERSALNQYLMKGVLTDPITRKKLDKDRDYDLPVNEQMKRRVREYVKFVGHP